MAHLFVQQSAIDIRKDALDFFPVKQMPKHAPLQTSCAAHQFTVTANKAGQRAQHTITHQESTCHTQNAEHLQACCSCTPPDFSGRRHTVLSLISLDAKDYNGLPLANCNAHGRWAQSVDNRVRMEGNSEKRCWFKGKSKCCVGCER